MTHFNSRWDALYPFVERALSHEIRVVRPANQPRGGTCRVYLKTRRRIKRRLRDSVFRPPSLALPKVSSRTGCHAGHPDIFHGPLVWGHVLPSSISSVKSALSNSSSLNEPARLSRRNVFLYVLQLYETIQPTSLRRLKPDDPTVMLSCGLAPISTRNSGRLYAVYGSRYVDPRVLSSYFPRGKESQIRKMRARLSRLISLPTLAKMSFGRRGLKEQSTSQTSREVGSQNHSLNIK